MLTDNLIHDTVYRRARRALVEAVHAADERVCRAGRSSRRVLFEAASPMSLAIFRPVFEQLSSDPRISFWFMTSDRSWDASRIFEANGISERIISPDVARWMKFDVYINADFWNMTWLPRRARRIHFFHGVAGKYDLDAPTRIAPVVASFDRLMFPNRDRLQRYAQAGLVDPDGSAAALVGYPKVDCLVDGSLDRQAIQATLGLNPKSPTVLYAPTWSPYSSLNCMGVEIIAAVARLGANVIVKLHDRSYDHTARASGGVDWQARLARLAEEWPVHVATNADASPYLFVADALVTDHSSVGFEFMLLDRPIVTIDSPRLVEQARINRDKVRLLHGASEVVADPNAAATAVARGLSAPAKRSTARRAIAADLFYRPGGATRRAVETIYDVLALPVPAALSEPSARPRAAAQGVDVSVLHPFETRTTHHV